MKLSVPNRWAISIAFVRDVIARSMSLKLGDMSVGLTSIGTATNP